MLNSTRRMRRLACGSGHPENSPVDQVVPRVLASTRELISRPSTRDTWGRPESSRVDMRAHQSAPEAASFLLLMACHKTAGLLACHPQQSPVGTGTYGKPTVSKTPQSRGCTRERSGLPQKCGVHPRTLGTTSEMSGRPENDVRLE